MTKHDLAFLRVWVEGERKALEWSVGERIFQITGVKGGDGLFERLPHPAPAHWTRERVSENEMIVALQGATSSLKLWRNENDQSFFADAEAALEAAKAWVEK